MRATIASLVCAGVGQPPAMLSLCISRNRVLLRRSLRLTRCAARPVSAAAAMPLLALAWLKISFRSDAAWRRFVGGHCGEGLPAHAVRELLTTLPAGLIGTDRAMFTALDTHRRAGARRPVVAYGCYALTTMRSPHGRNRPQNPRLSRLGGAVGTMFGTMASILRDLFRRDPPRQGTLPPRCRRCF